MTQTMTPLRRRMLDNMTIRNLAAGTRKIYVRSVANFSAFHGRSPDQLSFEDVRDYQLHLVARGLKATSICQIMSALRFFYGPRSATARRRWGSRCRAKPTPCPPSSPATRSHAC